MNKNTKEQFAAIGESHNSFLPLFEKHSIRYVSKDFLHLLSKVKNTEFIEILLDREAYYQERLHFESSLTQTTLLEFCKAKLEYNEDNCVLFIEELQCLPIRIISNANKDYIEMGESIYVMALKFIKNQLEQNKSKP